MKKLFGKKKKTVALLYIEDVITATPPKQMLGREGFDLMEILDFLEDLYEDDGKVDGLLLRLDTPGGTAGASEELARSIERVKKKKNIPVVASIGDICCSGGYMTACVADAIYANGQSLTGSIGTILQIPNYKGLAEKLGVTTVTIKSGRMKDLGNPVRDMTEEERAYLQEIAKSGHDLFKKFVSKRRPEIRNPEEMMDGRPVDAVLALENHLIDGIGTYYEAYRHLLERMGVESFDDVKEVYIKRKKGILARLFGNISLLPASLAETLQQTLGFSPIGKR